jgi:hypothetical protein
VRLWPHRGHGLVTTASTEVFQKLPDLEPELVLGVLRPEEQPLDDNVQMGCYQLYRDSENRDLQKAQHGLYDLACLLVQQSADSWYELRGS